MKLFVVTSIVVLFVIGIFGMQESDASCMSGSIRIDNSKYSSQHLVIEQDILHVSGKLVNLLNSPQDVMLTIGSSETRSFSTCGSLRSYLPDHTNDHLPDYEKEGIHFEKISSTFKNISLESNDSQFFEIELRPLKTGNYNLRIIALTDSYLDIDGGMTIIVKELSPLKQIKNGVALANVQCHDEKRVIYKHDRMSAACVTSSTYGDLIERGWAALRLETDATTDVGQNLCKLYGGDWDRWSRHCDGLESNLMCTMAGGNILNGDCIIPITELKNRK